MSTSNSDTTGHDRDGRMRSPSKRRRARAFSSAQLVQALPGALRKLDPRQMWRNPVMFLVGSAPRSPR